MAKKKKTIKVKVEEEPKKEPKKEKVRCFGIFDHGGQHYIRTYSTKDFPNAKEVAEKFAGKESRETHKRDERDEPLKIRSVKELTEKEVNEWEEIKRQEDIATTKERIRRAQGQPRSVFYGQEGEITPFK